MKFKKLKIMVATLVAISCLYAFTGIHISNADDQGDRYDYKEYILYYDRQDISFITNEDDIYMPLKMKYGISNALEFTNYKIAGIKNRKIVSFKIYK